MKTLAAVLVETGRPLELAELSLPVLKPGQVVVEVAYSGVCHTQLLECRGHRGEDRFLPHCLGHEGSGTVAEIGPGVTKVAVGDRVVLSWIKGRGADVPGTVYDWGGRRVNAGAITTFARFTIISENRLTTLDQDLPLTHAAALGCALPTGLGAVLNTARAEAGQSLVVFGSGGIGLAAIAAGAVAGCYPIVGVDLLPAKLELARRMGATHTVSAGPGAVDDVLAVCRGGADIAIEATGRPAVMQQALAAVRPQGGTAVVCGNAHHGESLVVDPRQLNQGKRLLGTWGGDSRPDRDYPRYARLMAAGRLDVSPLFSQSYALTAINAALDDLEGGRVAR
ncbi:MAG: zinc-binding dehydrogenase, partial [Acidobacteriota bacterium]|nr:zinc-binding dehydrogenase [Acidobacteriota bacterium]